MLIVNSDTEQKLDRLKKDYKPGSYIFYGEKGVGKKTAAFETAAVILRKTVSTLCSSSDFLYIKPEDSVIKTEVMEQVHSFSSYVSTGDIKICIIDDANLMTVKAQNALLKTIEETKSTLFFLISHERMLPTIQSRSKEIKFYPLEIGQMKRLYPDGSEILMKLSEGKPGQYELFRTEPVFLEDVEHILHVLGHMEHSRELMEVLHLTKEKDKNSFYEKYDKMHVNALLSVFKEIYLDAVTYGESDIASHVRNMYGYTRALHMCSIISDAMYRMKDKGKFTKNDFFDVIRAMM